MHGRGRNGGTVITWLIPIRDGTERLPGKNALMLTPRTSLLEYTVRAAVESETGRVVIVADGEEAHSLALCVAHMVGGNVSVIRQPSDIGAPTGSIMDVVAWAIRRLEIDEDDANGIGLLLATSPFRTADTIRRVVELWRRDQGASVCTVRKLHKRGVRYEKANSWLSTLVAPGFWKHQAADGWDVIPDMYESTGGAQLLGVRTFMAYRRFWIPKTRGVEVDAIEALDIDTEEEFRVAQAIAKEAA